MSVEFPDKRAIPETETHEEVGELDLSSEYIQGVMSLPLDMVKANLGESGTLVRTQENLRRLELNEDPTIVWAQELGFKLHEHESRKDGPYVKHLMGVANRLMEDQKITNPTVIAAAFLHDSIENHPKDLVRILDQEAARPERDLNGLNVLDIRQVAVDTLLAAFPKDPDQTTPTVAELVVAVSNPIPQYGEKKVALYTKHTKEIIEASPEARALKLADFTENAVDNHLTPDPKLQMRLDIKYKEQYYTHIQAIDRDDTLIPREQRIYVIQQLREGLQRCTERLNALEGTLEGRVMVAEARRDLIGEDLGARATREMLTVASRVKGAFHSRIDSTNTGSSLRGDTEPLNP